MYIPEQCNYITHVGRECTINELHGMVIDDHYYDNALNTHTVDIPA